MYEECLYYYGHQWNDFLIQLNSIARDIIQQETNFTFKRQRLHYQGYSYPLKFILFDHPTQLGYFNSTFLEIGIHKLFFYMPSTDLHNLLRHELAHFLCHILYRNQELTHGKTYRELCRSYGWGKEVYLSKQEINLQHYRSIKQHQQKIVYKIQKLLQLAKSANRHEAEIAALKANQLLVKHAIDIQQLKQNSTASTNTQNSSDTIVKRLYHGKRVSSKYRAIARILQEFYVAVIFNHGERAFYLEVVGSISNVEIATYVFNFLETKFEQLWDSDRHRLKLKGSRAKNSYFQGLAEGIVIKGQQSKKEHFSSTQLLPLEREVQQHKKNAYHQLSYSTTKGKSDHFAHHAGKQQGKKFTIIPALAKNKKLIKLLGF